MKKRKASSYSEKSRSLSAGSGTTRLLIKDEGYEPATYRQLLRYANFWDYFLLSSGLVFAVLDGICAPFGSLIFRGITDVLMAGQAAYDSGNFDIDEFSQGIIYYCVLYFLQGLNMFVLTILAMGCFHMVSERLAQKIKENYFKAVLAQDQEWFDRRDVGALTQLMTAGVDKIRHGTSDKLVVVIKSVTNLISGVAIAAYFSWELTLVILAMSPFLVTSMHFSHRMLITQTKKEAAAYSACGAIAEEVLSAIKTVTSFNGQLLELKRYFKSLDEAKHVGFRKALIVSFCTGLYGMVNFSAMGVGFYYGARLVFKRQISPGTVFGVFWCVFIGLMRFGMALPQFPTLLKARVAAGEIFSIIDCQPKMKLGGQLCPKAVEGRIELKNVHFRYPTRPEVKVLNGISLEIEPGQNVALVGHSGCGKSTIISLLMRYYQQESGSVTLDGIPLEDLNIEWLRSTIGIVSQEPVLFQTTVAENLKMGKSDVTKQEMEDACRMANAHEFIVKLENGYDTKIGDGGIRLSGGQKQRLAIARALIRKPRILLLDEATSALDTESERVVQDALDQASSGRTTITVAHRLSTVKNADKIIVFESGRIIEQGTHEQLFSNLNGFYRQLVLSQQINADVEEEFDTIEHEIQQASSPRTRISTLSSETPVSHQPDDQTEQLLMDNTVKPAGIRQILKYADMKLFFCGLVLSLMRGCSWPVFAVLYGFVFKVMSNPEHSTAEKMLYIAAGGYFALGILSGLSTWLSGNILGIVGEKLNVRLRMAVYKNLLRHNASYFDDPEHSVGKLTARLATDSNNVQAAVDQRLADVFQGLTSFFAGIGVAMYFGYQLALFCMTVCGIFIFIQYSISKAVKKRAQQDTSLEESEARLSCEFIANVKTIQSLTQETKICRRFEETSKEPYKRAVVRGWLMSCILAIGSGFVSLNFSASYLAGLLMIKLGLCSPFTVFQVIESLNIATMMVMATVSFFPEYSRAKVSAALIFQMLAEESEIDNFSEAGIKPEIQGNVQLSDVDFSYPNSRQILTLKKMSIRANFGQTIAIVGPSGCGKSTIIQLIERFYDILGGMIRIDGRDIRQINIRHLRSNIALVGQEPTLFNLSIRENISYGLDDDVSIEKIKKAAKLANIDKFIESLPEQYDTVVGGRGSQLSGGQRQRIAIARAIIREPKILLLDEATAALDGESEKLVQEALDRARYGRTCLVVAHRLSTIQNADLICVLDNGKCIEFGNHQQLLNQKGLYAKLVEKQSI